MCANPKIKKYANVVSQLSFYTFLHKSKRKQSVSVRVSKQKIVSYAPNPPPVKQYPVALTTTSSPVSHLVKHIGIFCLK